VTVRIEEILGRAAQGITEPFYCRASDGDLYFVKGRSVGWNGLINEWMAGHLGQAFGLPIPTFDLAEVPAALVRTDPLLWSTLGADPTFASREVKNSQIVTYAIVQEIPPTLARDIFVFDWWIQNEDRSLTESGGNPNLLWSATDGSFSVIDHNLAFAPTFSSARLLETHVFAKYRTALTEDRTLRDGYRDRCRRALSGWPRMRDLLPEEWHDPTGDQAAADRYLNAVYALLSRTEAECFWDFG